MQQKNVLSWDKSYHLNNYLIANKPMAESNSDKFLAEAATKHLGFTVTVSNIKISRVTTGVHHTERTSKKNIYGGTESKMLRRQNRTIARALIAHIEGRPINTLNLNALKEIAYQQPVGDDAAA